MHLEFLVEDLSGKVILEAVVPAIVGPTHTFAVHSYRGIGRLPRDLHANSDPKKRILLEQLPRLLQGYSRTFAGYPAGFRAAVIVVCDLDDRCLREFRKDLLNVLASCEQKPDAKFCIAVEEMEAWLLGDAAAIRSAYPKAKNFVLSQYSQDSICGTWEQLADAVYPGGSTSLRKNTYRVIGTAKCEWASKVAPKIDIDANASPSFAYFVTSVRSKIAT